MYTNELLEEKYRAQKELCASSQDDQKSYIDLIEHYAQELYKEKNWNLTFSKRKGGYEEPAFLKKAL